MRPNPRTRKRTDPADIEASVRTAVHAALEHKAEDLKVLHLEPVTDFTDYFLVLHGTNPRQVEAIADAIVEDLRAQGVRPLHVEGMAQSTWVLLDFGDFVIHVFQDDIRRFYALERLWGDAPDVTAQFTGQPTAPSSE